ncbi:MAG: alpha/beta hydrolase family protein [Alcanivoracaceae bacterium]|nr:alpha/beta hydrolase family protein [Alcanivoracaceae bacterium]
MAHTLARVHQQDYDTAEYPRFQQPWWEHLPEDFYRYPDAFAMPAALRRKVGFTVALDQLTRTGLASLVAAASSPAMLLGNSLQEDLRQQDFYESLLASGDRYQFFREPQPVSHFRESPVRRYHFHPSDGENVTVRFESPFQTVNPALRERYAAHRENATAWAQHWRHHDGPRPTLVVVHGFVADPYWLNARFLALPWFYKQGFDVLLYTMPFHGRRKSRLSPFSGAEFFAGGVSHINEAFAQTIHDLRIYLRYLRQRGVDRIGATGISLGGYTTGLLAAIDDQLSFAIPNVPVTSLFDLVPGWFPLSAEVRLLMRRAGISLKDLRHATAVHSPLTWSCQLPRDRRLIIGGVGDRFAPPKQAWMLWKHWEECGLHWFPGNHLLHLDQGRYLREMSQFMRASGF